MPRLIAAKTEERIDLAELIDIVESGPFDARDEDCFASYGEALKKLANNRAFLSDIIIAELKQRCDGQLRRNQYGPQVIMLHGPSQRCFIRANFWPAAQDSIIRHSGTDPFFYGVPHDHNFSFLTVGYVGPGYWSEYYEYDYESVIGYPGEPVALRHIERAKLDPGKTMLYRAHRDVHLQLPADELSISLNIVEVSSSIPFHDQYRFDVERNRIDGILTRVSIEPLLAIAAHHGGGNGADLVADFAARHPSDRVRFKAIRAQASALPNLDARIALLAGVAGDPSRLVAEYAKREVKRLEAGREWIERPASVPDAA